jgi:hypothetical protein
MACWFYGNGSLPIAAQHNGHSNTILIKVLVNLAVVLMPIKATPPTL